MRVSAASYNDISAEAGHDLFPMDPDMLFLYALNLLGYDSLDLFFLDYLNA